MFQMKEDVENEFSERMEQLRDMYKTEIEELMAKLETERSTAKALEVSTQSMAQQYNSRTCSAHT